MDNELKESLSRSDTWIRGLYMLLFYLIFSMAELVLALVVLVQFVMMLITGRINERLLEFGDDLTVFIYQILQFQTFNTEEKPFPFAPWPLGADADTLPADAVMDAADTANVNPAGESAPASSVAPVADSAPDADVDPKGKPG